MLVSFGSGAGSDAFCLRVKQKRDTDNVPTTRDYVNRYIKIDYAKYSRFKENYKLN